MQTEQIIYRLVRGAKEKWGRIGEQEGKWERAKERITGSRIWKNENKLCRTTNKICRTMNKICPHNYKVIEWLDHANAIGQAITTKSQHDGDMGNRTLDLSQAKRKRKSLHSTNQNQHN